MPLPLKEKTRRTLIHTATELALGTSDSRLREPGLVGNIVDDYFVYAHRTKS